MGFHWSRSAPVRKDSPVDLNDRLRFAAGSLAADFGGDLPVDLAEELVFGSAEGLLAAASVIEFVPILAERRARQALRSGAPGARPAVPSPPPDDGPTVTPTVAAAANPPAMTAVPEGQLSRLRAEVETARARVEAWIGERRGDETGG
jgi:hypothetical protein